jgi:NAD(P)-dependent dehydrogenase (short-subunit alcohol dehydrogenase family)
VEQTALLEVTDEEMRLVFETGPTATLRMMQLCYPHGEGACAAAKEAIRGLTKHAAVEWGPDNIRVNVICPLATHDPSRFPRRRSAASP